MNKRSVVNRKKPTKKGTHKTQTKPTFTEEIIVSTLFNNSIVIVFSFFLIRVINNITSTIDCTCNDS